MNQSRIREMRCYGVLCIRWSIDFSVNGIMQIRLYMQFAVTKLHVCLVSYFILGRSFVSTFAFVYRDFLRTIY